jgi:peptidoglycan/LPS O-acetylase OafA/YrhL
MASAGTYFRNLDSIRFIAASMVLLSHIIRPAFDYVQLPSWLLRFVNTICLGGNGVSIFFVMSGFLITYLLLEEHKLTGKIHLKQFYLRRFLRIWPLYFAVIIFAFGLYPLLKKALGLYQPLCTNVWYHISFLANFDVLHVREHCPGSDAMSQNVNWSVSIEEQFYLFWPLFFVVLPRKAWLPSIAIGLAFCFYVRLNNNSDPSFLYFHSLAVAPDLFIGGAFAILSQTQNRFKQFFESCGTGWQLTFMGILALLLLFRTELSTNGYLPALSRLPIALATALFICAQALSLKPGPANLVNWKFASRWGKYTYGIYLLHPIAMLVIDVCARMFKLEIAGFWTILFSGSFSIVLTFLISWLSYRYLERPFLNLKEKFQFVSRS